MSSVLDPKISNNEHLCKMEKLKVVRTHNHCVSVFVNIWPNKNLLSLGLLFSNGTVCTNSNAKTHLVEHLLALPVPHDGFGDGARQLS